MAARFVHLLFVTFVALAAWGATGCGAADAGSATAGTRGDSAGGRDASGPTASAADANTPTVDAGATACADGDASVQRHGAACLCCHSDEFGVAGSVDPSGSPVARVVVTDAHGDVADMAPNTFSNFFRHYTMTAPFRVTVFGPDGRTIAMNADSPSADCNRCHGTNGSTSPIHGP